MSDTKFFVGQRVSWCGSTGTVIHIDRPDPYPVEVRFSDHPHGDLIEFTSDGRYMKWHTKPSLKPLKRRKKHKGTPHWPALVRTDEDRPISGVQMSGFIWTSEEEARNFYGEHFIRLATELSAVYVEDKNDR